MGETGHARRASLVFLALLVLTSVFLMHGPSSDHMLSMPSTSMPSTSMTAISMTATHHSPGSHRGAGATAGHDTAMHHGECVGTLRSDVHLVPDDASTAAARRGHATAQRARAKPAPSRPPDLERLCVSRT